MLKDIVIGCQKLILSMIDAHKLIIFKPET